MEHIVIHSATSLRGRLQRGRGCAARRAAGIPGVREMVYDCVCHDPRWDTLEARGLYYARLILDLELDTGPLAGHLFDPADGLDADEDRTNLAIDVLGRLVRLGRRDAAVPLRRYARDGFNWYAALQALVEIGDPALAEGLDEVAAARCDDADLTWLCGGDGAVARAWALRQPRIAAARRPEARPPHDPRPPLAGRSDADLAALALSRGDRATAAILELGRRRSAAVLDLVEELMPCGRYDGPLCRALRDLGDRALARARVWTAEQRPYSDVGVDVLAAHGTDTDAPVLLGALDVALAEGDWDLAAVPAEGLGRLRARAAIPMLLYAWEESASSQLRVSLLGALRSVDPHVAEPYLVEALWDCEDGVRRIAAASAPLDGETRTRLRRLRHETAEDPAVRAAASRRLVSGPR